MNFRWMLLAPQYLRLALNGVVFGVLVLGWSGHSQATMGGAVQDAVPAQTGDQAPAEPEGAAQSEPAGEEAKGCSFGKPD